jgi:thiol-disulfide isomerase/thioredoxin
MLIRATVALVIAASALPAVAAEPGGSLPTAPRFIARDIDNRLVSVDTLIARGPLIIDFWATWCAPCRAEFRAIGKLIAKYADRHVTVLAVSEDGPSESAKVRQIVAGGKWPFIVVMDNGKSIAQKFNVSALPTLFLVGSDGLIHFYSRGYVPGDESKLEKALRDLSTGK